MCLFADAGVEEFFLMIHKWKGSIFKALRMSGKEISNVFLFTLCFLAIMIMYIFRLASQNYTVIEEMTVNNRIFNRIPLFWCTAEELFFIKYCSTLPIWHLNEQIYCWGQILMAFSDYGKPKINECAKKVDCHEDFMFLFYRDSLNPCPSFSA